MQKLVAQVIGLTIELEDSLPVIVEKEYQLGSYSQALKYLHQPTSMGQIDESKRRIGFAELFELILTGLAIKKDIKTESSAKVVFNFIKICLQ